MDYKKQIYLSQNLKHLLLASNLGQTALANKLGVNKSTLHNYIHGVTPVGIVFVLKVAEYFNIGIEDLLLSNLNNPDTGSSFKPYNLAKEKEQRFEVIIRPVNHS